MTVKFRLVDPLDGAVAFGWHRGFAEASQAIFPRERELFLHLIYERQVWGAVAEDGHFLAMSYIHFSEADGRYEVGGLMVSGRTRGQGLGGAMLRLPIAYTLFNEGLPKTDPDIPVMTHVLARNRAPRTIMTEVGFRFANAVEIPAEAMPGLQADADGKIRGDEFHFDAKTAIPRLADWCAVGQPTLKDGTLTTVEMTEGVSLADLATVLREIGGDAAI